MKLTKEEFFQNFHIDSSTTTLYWKRKMGQRVNKLEIYCILHYTDLKKLLKRFECKKIATKIVNDVSIFKFLKTREKKFISRYYPNKSINKLNINTKFSVCNCNKWIYCYWGTPCKYKYFNYRVFSLKYRWSIFNIRLYWIIWKEYIKLEITSMLSIDNIQWKKTARVPSNYLDTKIMSFFSIFKLILSNIKYYKLDKNKDFSKRINILNFLEKNK